MAKKKATWAIGDIHGRKKTLGALLERLDVDSSRDRLWLVGDLVNRGPDSLGVLRWARKTSKRLGHRFACVLGNHDLHLLAAWRGLRSPNDHLQPVLDAPDGDELLDWLRRRPLLVRGEDHVLVHAGLWPHWSLDEAEKWAHRVEKKLRDDQSLDDLLSHQAKQKDPSRLSSKKDKLSSALYAFTVLRMIQPDGTPSRHKGPPEEAPKGHLAWFDAPSRRSRDAHIVCGHWAALDHRLLDGVTALDSGVAWGGPLSACRLEDRRVVQQENLDGNSTKL